MRSIYWDRFVEWVSRYLDNLSRFGGRRNPMDSEFRVRIKQEHKELMYIIMTLSITLLGAIVIIKLIMGV